MERRESHHAQIQQGELIKHLPALRRYFRRRVPAADVDDLAQEVMSSMLARKLDSSVDNVDAYLFTVARNALARYLKGSDRRAGSSDELTLALVADESPSQDRELIGKIRLGAALDVIKAMPDRRRNIFVLHRFEEMTYNEIARHMGISVSAVEKHIMAALRALHGCLKAVP